MDKEQGSHLGSFAPLDYPLDHHHHCRPEGAGEEHVGVEMVDYMLGHPPPPQSQVSFDKLSFSDVLQFADFGPKLALNQPGTPTDDDDESYFLKFQTPPPSLPSLPPPPPLQLAGDMAGTEQEGKIEGGADEGRLSESTTLAQQLRGGGSSGRTEKMGGGEAKSGRRKRPRSMKTSEEVESQRMTHIAVERNRRRQMNEYLRILRSLMPGSYVQRGDQASIIGGAIEFIRELEQLIQCLESQKRRRLSGTGSDAPRPLVDGPPVPPIQPHQSHQQPPSFYPPNLTFPVAAGSSDSTKLLDLDSSAASGLREETAENKSCLADIEVRLLGLDAMIKILSRRRPGQLIKTIGALEDMHLSILHTNITTIEQTVLYSFNVKIMAEARFSAEDIASAVHQILSFIEANYTL